jgi:hypothetical protein
LRAAVGQGLAPCAQKEVDVVDPVGDVVDPASDVVDPASDAVDPAIEVVEKTSDVSSLSTLFAS